MIFCLTKNVFGQCNTFFYFSLTKKFCTLISSKRSLIIEGCKRNGLLGDSCLCHCHQCHQCLNDCGMAQPNLLNPRIYRVKLHPPWQAQLNRSSVWNWWSVWNWMSARREAKKSGHILHVMLKQECFYLANYLRWLTLSIT